MFNFEEDSKLQLGIQLADLAAHTCGTMMKDSLGLISKSLPAGENSGYDPDLPIELGFLMFASLRYSFLGEYSDGLNWETDDYIKLRTIHTERYGLVIDPDLNDAQWLAAENRFGSIYLGCIH